MSASNGEDNQDQAVVLPAMISACTLFTTTRKRDDKSNILGEMKLRKSLSLTVTYLGQIWLLWIIED